MKETERAEKLRAFKIDSVLLSNEKIDEGHQVEVCLKSDVQSLEQDNKEKDAKIESLQKENEKYEECINKISESENSEEIHRIIGRYF